MPTLISASFLLSRVPNLEGERHLPPVRGGDREVEKAQASEGEGGETLSHPSSAEPLSTEGWLLEK